MATLKIHPHKPKNAEILTKMAYGAFHNITQTSHLAHHKHQQHHSDMQIQVHRNPAHDKIVPAPHKTHVCTWCSAWICVIIVLFLILGSLIVLVVYLLFHPKLPHFDIEDAHLNSITLDQYTFLFNSEMVSLVRFTNTNAKVDIKYEYVNFKLYFRTDLIATQVLEPFKQKKREEGMQTLDMISSDVELKALNAQIMMNEANLRKKLEYQLIGTFRIKAKLGPIVRLPYWLYANCNVSLAYPNGTLADHSCRTHR